jgi:hypothetical protein
MFHFGRPRTPLQWSSHIVLGIVALFLMTLDASDLRAVTNEVVQPMRDRMPAIIPERDYDRWLNVSICKDCISTCCGYDADKMTAWKVDKAVGK